MTTVSVLKPGFLVSLKTSLQGGVNYTRRDTISEKQDQDSGALVSAWETVRVIPNPDEFANASKARTAARAEVSSVCCASAFGLLCPSEKEPQLQQAISNARRIADDHNANAQLSRVEVYVMVGRIAQDDAEAARAIASEVRSLLDAMQAGIKAADPEQIREAASKARALGAMLSPEVAGKVSEAVAQARTAARAIARRVETDGEAAAQVVASLSQDRINTARFAFLDMDEAPVTARAPQSAELDMDQDEAQARSDQPTPSMLNAGGITTRTLEF